MFDAIELQSKRLRLTPLRLADIPAIYEIAKTRESIEDFQRQAESVDDVRAWVEPSFADPDNFVWLIRREGQVIGLFDLCLGAEYSEVKERVCRVGYFVDVAHQGNGYATEALHTAVSWLFAHTPITRIEAGVTLHNMASYRALEKVGFVRERVERANWEWRGEVYDSAYYCLQKIAG